MCLAQHANSVVQQQRFDDNDQDEMMKKFTVDVFEKGVGKDIASSRKLLMTKNSIRVFDVAFSKHNIQEGWRAIGAFYPHDPVRIMSKSTGLGQADQGVDILRAIEEDFAPIIPRAGRVLDGIMSERLPFLPPPQIDNVAELGVHRERAVVFGDLFDAARALAAPDRVLREERRKDKEAQQAALPIATTKVLYDQRGFGRFLAADVKAQLKLRSVPFKHNDKLWTALARRCQCLYKEALPTRAWSRTKPSSPLLCRQATRGCPCLQLASRAWKTCCVHWQALVRTVL